MAENYVLVLTCEHAGNVIPARFKKLFSSHKIRALLKTHRGYDIGALPVAHGVAQFFKKKLFFTTFSRLLVDCNRSAHHPRVFSAMTKILPATEKQFILKQYYNPQREAVTHEIARLVASGRRVLHVAIHSFTPVLDGEVRQADFALLYDPKRREERRIAGLWFGLLKKNDASLRFRRNYPYHGAADGFATALRSAFKPSQYVGIEVEMNQNIVGTKRGQQRLTQLLTASLEQLLD